MFEELNKFYARLFTSGSTQADLINNLFEDYLLIAGIILFIVAFLVLGGILFFHHKRRDPVPRQITGNKSLELVWTLIPLAVVTVLFLLSLKVMRKINQPVLQGRKPDIIITAHQWWWDFRYPKEHIVTANELHIPVDKKLLMQIESADVIHSWWVPDLGRKIDAIPGRTNYGWINADTTGIFEGTCSEFCGTEHAWMRISVIAQSQGDFDRWVEAQRRIPGVPGDSAARVGEVLFQQKTCGNCHAIHGTPADARIGPDLTHVGSRRTLLSGMKKNTPGNMEAWLKNPQEVKKGANMPDFLLSKDEIHDLTKYLEQLK